MIEVKVRLEAGFEPALHGMSLSHNLEAEYKLTGARIARAHKLAPMQGGHNKFLESIMIWVEVNAPRYWWQQADTYRLSTKQSASTMHTILKQRLTSHNFAVCPPEAWLAYLNKLIEVKDFETLKSYLPEGFMQCRMWLMSYKTLQNIYMQRKTHKLREWIDFLFEMLHQIEHPEFIDSFVKERSK